MVKLYETLAVGPLQENCYLVGDDGTRDAVCIDPGAEAERILEAIRRHALNVRAILITHSHFDHIGAVSEVREALGVRVFAPDGEQELWSMQGELSEFFGVPMPQPPDPDEWIYAGTVLEFGAISLEARDVRGHSPSSLGYYAPPYLFAGDALFAGSIGRTDLPGQDHGTLVDRIRTNILCLSPDTVVCPGHGPTTTVERESRTNPFL